MVIDEPAPGGHLDRLSASVAFVLSADDESRVLEVLDVRPKGLRTIKAKVLEVAGGKQTVQNYGVSKYVPRSRPNCCARSLISGTTLICEPVLKRCAFLVIRFRAHLFLAYELTELVCMAEKRPD